MRSPLYALLVLLAVLAVPASAQAFTLGAADGTTEAAPLAAQLGARTYRLVMDPNIPLDAYAPRIEAYRAAGMRPQIVVGGTGTTVRGRTTAQKWRIINYAIHAQRRWPDAYSISVVNEPNISGISSCQYARTFRTAYKMLHRAGARRVLFGEWAPANIAAWTTAVAACANGHITADGFAWHCYDAHPTWEGIDSAPRFRRVLRALRGRISTRSHHTLPLYCTEYGVITRSLSETTGPPSADAGARKWGHTLAVAAKYDVQEVVAWGIVEAPSGAKWDTSVVDSDGNQRQAFGVIASAR